MDKNTFMSKNLWLKVQFVFEAHLRSGTGAGWKTKSLVDFQTSPGRKDNIGLYMDFIM